MQKTPKIGLALGSGGAYGFAYLGIFEELEKAKIPVYCISGCSIGAIIGGLYAAGASVEQMTKFAKKLRFLQIIDFGLGGLGFVKGNRAVKQLRKAFELFKIDENIENCKIKFGCKATDLLSAKSVAMTSGSLIDAMRASFSIPGVFRPYEKDGMFFIDGGPICRVPVRLAKELGADFVVGIDCVGSNLPMKREELNSYAKLITRIMYIMDYNASIHEMNEADILIDMHQEGVDTLSLKSMEKSIKYGKKYGKILVKQLKEKFDFKSAVSSTSKENDSTNKKAKLKFENASLNVNEK